MKQDKEKWVVGLDEDRFNCDDTYPNKEEAIKAGREELMNAEPYNLKSYTSYSEVFHDDIDDDITENCLQNLVKNGVMIQNGRFL